MESSSSRSVDHTNSSPSEANAGTHGADYSVDALPVLRDNCSELQNESEINVQECEDLYYNMNHARRGLAVIFNHKKFDSNLDLEERTGTDADRDNLVRLLRTLIFAVVVHNDLSYKELDCELDKVAAENFEHCDCLLIVFLSHGEHRNRIYARDTFHAPPNVFERFTPQRCPSLAGKPKLFLIQACRGDELENSVDVYYDRKEADVRDDRIDAGRFPYRMPSHSDFLFAYSTIPGYLSWRHGGKGSWFVQAFCEQMTKHWMSLDFQTILTLVNRQLAFDFKSNKPSVELYHRRQQTPTFTSQLTRILQFQPKTVDNNGTVETV